MQYPNLSEEKKLWKKGYKIVACIDEAGRGPLAGPVAAAAVIINHKSEARNPKQIPNSKFQFSKHIWDLSRWVLFRNSDLGFRILLNEVRDSKQLSWGKREKIYKLITRNKNIWWGIGIVSEKIIDKINIFEATKLAMKKALKNLEKKLQKKLSHISYGRRKYGIIDFVILDGNIRLDIKIPQKAIVKADVKVFSCSTASIIAKVTRDRLMLKYHRKYPQYFFDKHKGYGTKLHFKMLQKYGHCKIHRKSFRPVKNFPEISV